jgi:hypothetical protein
MTDVYIRLIQFIPTEMSVFYWIIFRRKIRDLSTISQNDELIRGLVVVFRKVRMYCPGVDISGLSLVIG